MKNLKSLSMTLLLAAAALSAQAAFAQQPQPPKSSAESSNTSAAAAANDNRCSGIIAACSAAADELAAARNLIAALDAENKKLRERLETEKQTSRLLTELAGSRKDETEALRAAIAAKDEAIAKQNELIGYLKKKKSSPWKRVGDILVGVAAGALLR